MSIDLTTFRAEDGSNTKRRIEGVYTGPASYVAGGDALTPAELKLGQLHVLLFGRATNGTVVLDVAYDYTNQKVKWFVAAGTESVAGTDLSGYSCRFEAIGL